MPNPFSKKSIDKAVAAQPIAPQAMAGLGAPPATDIPSSISPNKMALLGGIADASSTYNFLRRGTGTEGNPIYAGLHNNPFGVGAAVAGTSLAMAGARKLIGKKYPRVADALAANQGTQQLMLGLSNFDDRPSNAGSGDDIWHNTLAGYRNRK